jgi:glycerol-3-phosphate O-acyltransferase
VGVLQLVFVAGAKVRTDLFTIPFSKGLNLICIHSKKYIEDDPATKPQKMQENLSAMKVGADVRMYVCI